MLGIFSIAFTILFVRSYSESIILFTVPVDNYEITLKDGTMDKLRRGYRLRAENGSLRLTRSSFDRIPVNYASGWEHFPEKKLSIMWAVGIALFLMTLFLPSLLRATKRIG